MKKLICDSKSLWCGFLPGAKPVVLVSCGSMKKSNIAPVSYVGQISDFLIYVSLRPSRFSNKLIRKNKKFAVNFVSSKFVKEIDFCGLVSGRKVDKFKATGFSKEKGKTGIPLIKEAFLSIEFGVKKIIRIGAHDVFVGEIKSFKKRKSKVEWLFHEGEKYFAKKGIVGKVYCSGKGVV